MIRPFTALCLIVAGGSGLYLYSTKHQSQVLDRQIAQVVHQADAIRERAGVLRAEYALLNDPERLGELSNANLPNLRPTAPTQFSTWNDFAKRLPAVGAPPAAPAPLEPDEPAVAATEDAPGDSSSAAATVAAAATAAAKTLVGPAMAAESKPVETRAPRTEPARTEIAKVEPARIDAFKADPGKTDSGKTDAGKTDGAKGDLAKTDGKADARPDAGKAEVAKADARPAAAPRARVMAYTGTTPVAPLPTPWAAVPPAAPPAAVPAPAASRPATPARAPVSLTASLGHFGRTQPARPVAPAPVQTSYSAPALWQPSGGNGNR